MTATATRPGARPAAGGRPRDGRLPGARPARGTGGHAAGLAAAGLVLACVVAASLALGTRGMSPGTVVEALVAPRPGDADHMVVRELRLPRTLIGLAAGAALGLAGTLIQAATRNPIADPGLLGLNAGACLGVVAAITWLGVASPVGYIWFAFAGTLVAGLVVHGVTAMGRGPSAPTRLTLAGVAVTAALTSITTTILLGDVETLDRYRFWVVGSLVGRDAGALASLLPFLLTGAALALALGRGLDALALGDDVARGLGHRVGRTRALTAAAVVLLCGSAAALAGPLAFVGLVAPHAARRLAGADHRWVLRYALVLGPALVLAADVAGRFLAPPGEMEAGLVIAVVGAPVMIAVVRSPAMRRA
ncbi:MAG TPA: iron ABC transporter permease [Miltoncostaeaceae bacterium]|nr:iron ABC transporter permease [Miltoncostaeaceae bacterium]